MSKRVLQEGQQQQLQQQYRPTKEDHTEDLLHVVMYYSVEQCKIFLNSRNVDKQQLAITGCNLGELVTFTGTQSDDNINDMTHSGLYWSDFIQCHCLLGTQKNEDGLYAPATEERYQTKTQPDFLTTNQWFSDLWIKKKTSIGQLKIQFKLLAYRIKYPMERVVSNIELGAGHGVSHLCDVAMCVNPDHMDVSLVHQLNMDRQRCLGVTLLVYNDVIVGEKPCIHTRNGDIKGTCCRRVHVVYINDWGALVVSKQYKDKMSSESQSSNTQ
jgi:hypothetical protein